MEYEVNDFISSLDKVPTASPNDNLGSALNLVESSHKPVYVFDKNSLVGLVSSYGALYAKRYAFTTELHKLMVVPPRLTNDSSLFEVIDQMLSTRLYELPIFSDSGEVIGIIKSRDILEKFKEDKELINNLSERIRIKKPATENINATIKDIYHRLRKKEATRIVLVDDKGKLVGIVARSDIKEAFIRPTQRIRFSKKIGRNRSYSFDEEEFKREDEEVRKFYQKNVFTAPYNLKKEEIVKKLIESGENSIVLVNRDVRPVGIVSIRDILKTIYLLKPEKESKIIIKKPSSKIPEKTFLKAYELLERFEKKIDKREPVNKVEIKFNESKSIARSTIIFNTTLVFDFFNGDRLVAESKQYQFLVSVKEVINEIEKQLRRKGK
ncbi:CBS domain-containing protein [Patescibacteria group bacterium]|nr:CBS domain-containing protein [Patescibacteria group bacterium]